MFVKLKAIKVEMAPAKTVPSLYNSVVYHGVNLYKW